MKSVINNLTIESLAYTGFGVGKMNGKVYFVDQTCPGDKVDAEIYQQKKNFGKAQISKIIQPSALRQNPPCVYFPRCGGCQWQHVSYQEQLNQKAKILGHALKISVPPFIGSPDEFGYRNRLRLHWTGKNLGLNQRQSKSILQIDSCMIAHKMISGSIQSTVNYMTKHYLNSPKHVDLILTPSNDIERVITDWDSLEYPPFSQVNPQINELIKNYVQSNLPLTSDLVLDLYCGNGNFSFLAQKTCPNAHVIGVEAQGKSISNAIEFQKQNSVDRMTFHSVAVERFLASWSRPHGFLTIVLDPPRTGCSSEVINWILRLKADAIIYISCDPMTLSRDIKLLTQDSTAPFEIQTVSGFDMFPQTYHLEAVVILRPKLSNHPHS